MMIVIGLPITSSAFQPKMRSAPLFHVRMIPSSVLLTIASSDDSIIAARRACASVDSLSSCISLAPLARGPGGAVLPGPHEPIIGCVSCDHVAPPSERCELIRDDSDQKDNGTAM